MSFAHVKWQGWCALVIMSVQNGLAILLMRYSKVNGDAYDSQVAVLMQELVVKLPISAALYSAECGPPFARISCGQRHGASSVSCQEKQRLKHPAHGFLRIEHNHTSHPLFPMKGTALVV